MNIEDDSSDGTFTFIPGVHPSVIPAQAGIQVSSIWTPACAGVTAIV